MSPASRSPRCSNEAKNGKSARMVPSRQQASSSTSPGSTRRTDSTTDGLADTERGYRGRPAAHGEMAAGDPNVV